MCGRFYLSYEGPAQKIIEDAFERFFRITGENTTDALSAHDAMDPRSVISTGEIFPSSIIPVIANSRNLNPSTYPMRWGYNMPHYGISATPGNNVSPGNPATPSNHASRETSASLTNSTQSSRNLLINARSETASIKPLFSESWKLRRCLIPMDYYFEWEHVNGRATQKYAIGPTNSSQSYLVGLYRFIPTERLPQCVILTQAPSLEISFIHNRMPVIFSEENKNLWLDPNANPMQLLLKSESSMQFRKSS